jgi:formylglycine-generating enzyme required for sulfatase activity
VFEEALAVVRGHAGSTAASARPAPPDLSQAVHPLAPEPKVTSSTAPAAPPAPAGTCPVGFEPRTLAPLLPPACWDAHGTLVRVPVAGGGAPFLVDWTEVTVADYAACVADGACTLAGEGSGCFGRSAAGAGMPVNCVDRPQAEAWCAWAGRRLCTAEEHVRAARGPGGAAYPWGEEPADCERAIRDGRGTPGASSAPGCGRGGPWPVGSRPAGVSPVGALDLSGNLAEWVAGSTGGAAGGSYMDKAPEELRADGLRPIPADLPLPDVGFRCCLDAAPTP